MEELIGQLMMLGFHGKKVPVYLKKMILEEGIGGVILFSRNIESAPQVKELISELQELSKRRDPESTLLISIDQEGGRVFRLPPPFRQYPSYRDMASSKSVFLLRDSSESLAAELVELGINMNMAPVLDVDTNPENPVIGDRSFGPDPHRVAELGTVVFDRFSKMGLLAVGKHFPGHGDTSLDSHIELPTVLKNEKELEQTELVPFRALISKGLQAIMTAHILFPKIDGKFPATLSKFLLRDLLRKSMNFEGVLLSDDLEMKGISDNFTVEEIVQNGLEATLDIFLCCHTEEVQKNYLSELKKRYRENGILKENILFSIKRLIRLKKKLKINRINS
ncbi:MAG: beta-N-acetylhexosaminidase [Nitrospinota bacterium]